MHTSVHTQPQAYGHTHTQSHTYAQSRACSDGGNSRPASAGAHTKKGKRGDQKQNFEDTMKVRQRQLAVYLGLFMAA